MLSASPEDDGGLGDLSGGLVATLEHKMSVRDIPPYNLRMTPDLKGMLQREARINGRSLNSEIIARLQDTLAVQESAQRRGYAQGTKSPGPKPDAYLPTSDAERAMMMTFRKLAPEKQLALLSLFK